MLTPPARFRFAIAALNEECEFDANAPAQVALTDRKHFLGFTQPYWAQLRNEAHVLRQVLFKQQKDWIASDGTYRKAQDIFVRTLRVLVESWWKSAWNLDLAFRKYPEMKLQIERFLRKNPLAIMPASRGASLVAAPFGQGAIKRVPQGKDMPFRRARGDAIALFIELARHPECERLGKCLRCERYFYGRPGQKCCPRPRRCGSYRAAIEAAKRKWHDERRQKLDRARAACAEWAIRKPRPDWKLWVANQIGVTPKWLTRVVNSGELTPPEQGENGMARKAQKSSRKEIKSKRRKNDEKP